MMELRFATVDKVEATLPLEVSSPIYHKFEINLTLEYK